MIAYLDSSVILRVILADQSPLAEWQQIDRGITSAITEVECLRTIDRIRLHHRIAEDVIAERREAVFEMMATLSVVEVTPSVLARASLPLPVTLRTLDAIHLATAQLWREQSDDGLTSFATHDHAQGLAARSVGFRVVGQ